LGILGDETLARKFVLVVFLGLAAFFCFAYYVRYFKWRDCFNELGRCYDSDTGMVYLEQAGAIWLSLAVLTFGISLYQIWRLSR